MSTAVDRPRCGAKTRAGGTCRHGAGYRTATPGVGRCWRHGGLQADGTDGRLRSGRYSKVLQHNLASAIAEHEQDPDPLNLLPEIAALRALFENFMSRAGEKTDELTDGDTAQAASLLEAIGRMVERVEKARAANAIGRPELYRVIMQIIRIIDANVPDPAARERIVTELNAIAF